MDTNCTYDYIFTLLEFVGPFVAAGGLLVGFSSSSPDESELLSEPDEELSDDDDSSKTSVRVRNIEIRPGSKKILKKP